MPTYDFRCKDCGHRFEVTRSFTENGIPACPSCGRGEHVVKVFPKVGISFKGSGFYKTDSRGSSSKSSSGTDGSESSSSSRGRLGFGRRRLVRRLVVRSRSSGVLVGVSVRFDGLGLRRSEQRLVERARKDSSGRRAPSGSSSSTASTAKASLMAARAEVGIFGGSGLYELLDGRRARSSVDTPYGPPSSPLHLGDVGGRRGRLPRPPRPRPRHPAHLVNYRANLWAMK